MSCLAEHCRGKKKVDPKEESVLRRQIINVLKDVENLLKDSEKLPLNVSDFFIFSTLSYFLDANMQKAVKGLKGFKSRWD